MDGEGEGPRVEADVGGTKGRIRELADCDGVCEDDDDVVDEEGAPVMLFATIAATEFIPDVCT